MVLITKDRDSRRRRTVGSERALRRCVTFRKITNGVRTEWGARLYADIRSVIETTLFLAGLVRKR
jgi:hypothetical protein